VEPSDLLKIVVEVLERLQLPYFVTGSMASTHYGIARFTNDIDVVVDLPIERIRDFCTSFPSDDFYVSEDAARDAVLRHSQFNILHPTSGLKIDVMVPDQSAFNRSRLTRRRNEPATKDFAAWYASPEDVILKKMDWYRIGESERHLRDIAEVLQVRGDSIDRAYIESWVQELGLEDIWKAVQQKVAQ
jgi:hypothetical protein